MRNCLISFLAGIACLLTAHTAVAAPIELAASHTIVSQTQSATGTTQMVVSITVTNTSMQTLTNIAVAPVGPGLIIVPHTSTLAVESPRVYRRHFCLSRHAAF